MPTAQEVIASVVVVQETTLMISMCTNKSSGCQGFGHDLAYAFADCDFVRAFYTVQVNPEVVLAVQNGQAPSSSLKAEVNQSRNHHIDEVRKTPNRSYKQIVASGCTTKFVGEVIQGLLDNQFLSRLFLKTDYPKMNLCKR